VSFPEPPLLSSRQVIRALKRAGFKRARKTKGSHQAYQAERGGRQRTVIVAAGKKEIPRGTLGKIIEQAGMTPYEFAQYLK